jgi:transcriptional accessory protein Tex/SPT6
METDNISSRQIPLSEIKPKMRLQGKVSRIELSGAIVDVGAEREGLLHISALGKDKIHQVQDVLQIGQEITVWVRKVDSRKGELQLTMIEPLAHDWGDLKPGSKVHGKVTRVEKFGVFLDFGAERPGLIHISELSSEYVKDPSTVAHIGEELDAVILEVDRQKKQVHLSRKALEARKETAPAEEVEKKRRQQEEILNRTLQTASRK